MADRVDQEPHASSTEEHISPGEDSRGAEQVPAGRGPPNAVLNRLTERIIGGAIEVHKVMGAGLLESTYKMCLEAEFEYLRIAVEREVAVPLVYRGRKLKTAYRMDMLVEGRVVVELKTVESLHPAHTVQVLTYLRHSGHQVGLLFNFHAVRLMDGGMRRLVWGYRAPGVS